MANEEVAEGKVLVDGTKSLLELVQANRESALVTWNFPSDLVEHDGGCRDDNRLNVVDPGVDLSF